MNQVLVTVIRRDGRVERIFQRNLRTNTGTNHMAEMLGSVTLPPIRNIALSQNTGDPSSSDTNLIDELSTDGLSRKTATFSHTANQSLYTQSATWQYTGGSTVTVAKAAMAHDATDTDASTDTHLVITKLSAVAVLTSNDTLSLDWGLSI